MPFRISFNLGDADLRHFETVAQRCQARTRERTAEAIVAAAREVLEKGQAAHVAAFVQARFERLRIMIDMASDADWELSDADRQRVLNALACFSEPAPANAGAGLLEQGIMIELVSRDLAHDIDAYLAFCRYRRLASQRRRPGADQQVQREQWLAQKRIELQTRMRERRQRDLDRAGSSVRRLFSLFGL